MSGQKRSTWIAFESPVTGSGLIVNRAWADKFQTEAEPPRFLRRPMRNGNRNERRIPAPSEISWRFRDVSKNHFGTAWEIKILRGSCLTVQSFPGIWNLRIVRSAKLTRMKFVVRCIRSRKKDRDLLELFLTLFRSIILVVQEQKISRLVEILFLAVSINFSRKCYETFTRYCF